jgi:hypothetical protein
LGVTFRLIAPIAASHAQVATAFRIDAGIFLKAGGNVAFATTVAAAIIAKVVKVVH